MSERLLNGLPVAEAELFMSQIDPPAESWEEFWEDYRWATCWQEEDGTWVIHVNENPGGYFVCEWRLPPGGSWQDTDSDYDFEAERQRIAATPPKRAPHQEFLRGQTVYTMDCVTWDEEDEGQVTEATVVKYCGGNENSQHYNVTHPKWGQVGVTRWKGGDYPTNVFSSREEAEGLYQRVLERRKDRR
jgi:hypothetical protein